MNLHPPGLTIGTLAETVGVNVDHPVLPTQGVVAGTGQTLRQHPTL